MAVRTYFEKILGRCSPNIFGQNLVFLSFHWVFSGAKWKKEFKKGKKGRIVATNAKTLPHSVIIYI